MVSLLRPMVDKAFVETVDQYDRMVNLRTELSSLKRIVSLIEGALPEAEEKQVDNPRIRVWLRDLDDICYDARDILDEFVTVSAASIRAKRASKRVKSNSLHYFYLRVSNRFATVIPFRLRFRLANKIKNLRKRLYSMKKDMETDKLLDFVGGAGCSPNAPKKNRPETGSYPDKHMFVGREVEKEKIMEKLLNLKENHVEVVPIWGMGGVGKNTLAQSVYNDERVTEKQYPTKNRRWLCVGEKKFNVKEIISKIIGEFDTNDVAVYQRKLIEKLWGDRFLIILDDIWDVGINEWELFCNPLNTIREGGLIIITTRTKDVIIAINTVVPNALRSLSNEDCWQIFESHAFTDAHSCSDLEQKKGIGKQIVEKLKGLPLAAKVVGLSLLNESDVQTWRSFLEADEWKLRIGDDDVMPVLRWSYNRLPPHLKQCFAYCSLFPKDHIFDKKMLVEMWMAHGFIQSVEGGGEKKRLEDTGADYFKQLVNASFFQCVDDEYVMHDLIHDLALVVSREEFLRTDDLRLDVGQLENVRHISIHHTYFWNLSLLCTSKRSILKRLLTLHTRYDWNSSHIPETSIAHITPLNVIQDIFKQLKSIRVLVLVSGEINYIPECISDLIHLRYLNIKGTNVRRIPDTLCDLHNLQTLVAPTTFPVVTVLPENIGNMLNLRHLRACLLTCKGVKNLTSLQELHSISVSKDDKISELRGMRQLHGKLTIKCLENVTSEEDAAQAMMQEKTHIDDLELKFTNDLGDSTDVQTKVLDALQCPPNLINLEIRGYNGLTSPNWMADGKLFKDLRSLHLSDCHRLESLPPLGQLNCLKQLWFERMGAIKKLGEEFYGKQINQKVFFPSLETLYLFSMMNLKEWGDIVIADTSVTYFPCLKYLKILECPNLVSALPYVKICTPHMDIKDPSRNAANIMRSLSELHIRNCHELMSLTRLMVVSHTFYKSTENGVFRSLSSLKNLEIYRCPRLHYFPRLDAIEELDVRECENLTSLSFSDRGLNSLRSLTVFNCSIEELDVPTSSSSSSSSALQLSRLRVLRTNNRLVFSKMFEHDLVSLQEMWIGMFSKVESLFKLALLETLVIFKCDDLESLPPDIHKLSSLKTLSLLHCPQLQELPGNGLPLSLELLVIIECPLLYERCQVESGADWHKIKHIPEREILETITFPLLRDLARRLQLYGLYECPKNEAYTSFGKSVPDFYLEEKGLQKLLLLVGLHGSGTTTIFKQEI